ncbi:DNA-binding MarR family transcriptional regulator [Pseudochelatococcus lubricantis]|uniref:DNA-binding MarR family transcriptional regulator n=1 Tax=Pseudochelatococcus lubricantis TaxID=1538102 RepID=A0ABX0V4A5_9HYPH|nr:DNA-binding MarR family transcriptional regulator [Pseudochelatococcus lubricantis]
MSIASSPRTSPAAFSSLPESGSAGADDTAGRPGNDIVELLFFAYRDFVSDPDRLLTQYGFGRAHHRVLHFVERQPGMTIAEMLDILGITKQSLNPILKDLVEKGYIVQRTGTVDRRQRLLFPTDKGRALSLDLTKPQLGRIARALAGTEPDVRAKVTAFLFAMIDPDDHAHVARLVWTEPATDGHDAE